LGNVVHGEFFAKLFLLETVDASYFDNAIQLFGGFDVFIFKPFAFIKLRVVEVDDPDLLSTVEGPYVR
jgi:hypothetical protein